MFPARGAAFCTRILFSVKDPLGDQITQHAFCAWISADAKYLFFHSLDTAKGNIYWISTDIITYLRN